MITRKITRIGKAIVAIISVLIVLVAAINLIVRNTFPANIDKKIAELKSYCESNGYSTNVGILVDYGIHSGRARFYVCNLQSRSILINSICAQGCGKGQLLGKNEFSNTPGSCCTSLGHYEIGRKRKMYSMNRMAYELDVLDDTNSNARQRNILLHPVRMPDISIYPFRLPSKPLRILGRAILRPFSEGCITIPFDKFNDCSKHIDKEDKPIVMWVYKC